LTEAQTKDRLHVSAEGPWVLVAATCTIPPARTDIVAEHHAYEPSLLQALDVLPGMLR
jgi:hypothetical protein